MSPRPTQPDATPRPPASPNPTGRGAGRGSPTAPTAPTTPTTPTPTHADRYNVARWAVLGVPYAGVDTLAAIVRDGTIRRMSGAAVRTLAGLMAWPYAIEPPPSVGTLAETIGIDRKSCGRALAELVALGVIRFPSTAVSLGRIPGRKAASGPSGATDGRGGR